MRKRPALFGLLFLVLGIALVLKGAWDWREDANILWNGVVVEGKVVSREEIPVEGGKPRLQMAVELAIGGETRRPTFNVAKQFYDSNPTTVTARYLADDPSRIRLSGEEMKPNDALVLGMMVFILGLLLCGIQALRRRQARDLAEVLPASPSGETGKTGGPA